jgi:hypothetical protein
MPTDNPLPAGATETPNAHFTSPPNFKAEAGAVTQAMVDLILKNAREGRATFAGDLKKRFTASQISAHWSEAVRVANRTIVRDVYADMPDETIAIEAAPTVVERMVKVILERVGRDQNVVAALQKAGFTGPQIAAHLDEAKTIVNRQLRLKVPPAAGFVDLAYAIGRMAHAQVQA